MKQNAPRFALETGKASHQGLVRPRNEDRYFVNPRLGVWAVADGIGGHEGGDIASEAIARGLATVGFAVSAPDLLARVRDRLTRVHADLRLSAREREIEVMGATVVALLIFERFYACVWSGDSRAYLIRQDRIVQVSRDHTEVQDLVDRGILDPREARGWAGNNAITRAVGVHDVLELAIEHGELSPDDVFVLCSDGLTAHVGDDEILALATRHPAQAACEALVQRALDRGGHDNVTVVIVRCRAARGGANTAPRVWT